MNIRTVFFDREGWLRVPWILASALLISAILISGIVLGVNAYERAGCRTQAAGLHRPYKYGFIGGCRVEVDGVYVPIDNYRVQKSAR